MEHLVRQILNHWARVPQAISTAVVQNTGTKLLQYQGCCLELTTSGILKYNDTPLDCSKCLEQFLALWEIVLTKELERHLSNLKSLHREQIHQSEHGSYPPTLTPQEIQQAVENLDTIIPEDGTAATRRLNRLYRALKKAGYTPTTKLKKKEEEEDND